MTAKRIHWIVLTILMIAGCGDSVRLVNTAPSTNPSAPTLSSRIRVGVPVQNAQVRLEDTSGNVLSRAITDLTGTVNFPIGHSVTDGRIVVSLPDSPVELSTEFRNHQSGSSSLPGVTLPTTLASALVKGQGLSLEEAESRVKRALGLRSHMPLDLGEPNPYFSSLSLLRAAGQDGGWNSFRDRFTQSAVGQSTSSDALGEFDLSASDLTSDFQDLGDGALQELALRLQQRFVAFGTLPDGRGQVRPLILASEGYTFGKFLFAVLQGVSGNITTGTVGDAFTQIFSGIGSNNATAQQLAAVNQELSEVTAELSSLFDSLRDAEVAARVASLEALFAPARGIVSQYLIASQSLDLEPGTPFTPPTLLTDLLDRLNGESTISPVTLVQANINLGGNDGLIRLYLQDVAKGGYGLNRASDRTYPTFVAYHPSQTAVRDFYSHFVNEQMLTYFLIGEDIHNSLPGAVSGADLDQLELEFYVLTSYLKAQAQLLPWTIDNPDIAFDLDSNTVWYRSAIAPTDLQHVTAKEDETITYPDGTSQTFSLTFLDGSTPTRLQALQSRGRYAPNPGYQDPNRSFNTTADTISGIYINSHSPGDYGVSLAGVGALGFDYLDQLYNNHTDQERNDGQYWASKNGVSAPYFSFNLDGDVRNDNLGTDNRPYLIGAPIVEFYGNYNSDGTPALGDYSKGMVLQFGVPSGVSISQNPIPITVTSIPFEIGGQQTSFDIPPNSYEFVANVTYNLSLQGNSIVVGDEVTGTMPSDPVTGITIPFPSETFSTTPNYDHGTGEQVNKLREIINWKSSNPKALRVYNIPGLGGVFTELLPNTTVTVTASILDQNGVEHSSTLSHTTGNFEEPTLASLKIIPSNQIYGASPSQRPSGTYVYKCLGYYQNNTVVDLSHLVTWSVTPSPNPANAQIVQTNSGAILSLNAPPGPASSSYDLTVTAELDGVSQSTSIRVIPPPASP